MVSPVEAGRCQLGLRSSEVMNHVAGERTVRCWLLAGGHSSSHMGLSMRLFGYPHNWFSPEGVIQESKDVSGSVSTFSFVSWLLVISVCLLAA